MTELIIHKAIENVENQTGIKIQFDNKVPIALDGKIKFKYNNQWYTAFVEVKKELRNHQLHQLKELKSKYHPLMIIAEYIFPKIKEELRKQKIAYLEINGNIYFKEGDLLLWLDDKKAQIHKQKKMGRAFTKTGLKLIFHFLLKEDFINLPYRQIAKQTGVGFGNINFIMTDLKQQGFLLKLNKNTYKLNNKKELIEKWMEAYEQKLKPAILIGTFRFVNEKDFLNWEQVPLQPGKTWWGGEPAADLLTKYLKPGELTLYTLEKRNELIKNYKLLPDEKGNLKVYQKFWNYDELKTQVPPLLVYIDLMIAGDRRSMEAAKKIYDAQLQNQF